MHFRGCILPFYVVTSCIVLFILHVFFTPLAASAKPMQVLCFPTCLSFALLSLSLSCYLATIPDINRFLAVHIHSSFPILSCQPHNLSPVRLHYPVIHSLVQFPIFPLVAQIIYYKMGQARYSLFPYSVQTPVIEHHT